MREAQLQVADGKGTVYTIPLDPTTGNPTAWEPNFMTIVDRLGFVFWTKLKIKPIDGLVPGLRFLTAQTSETRLFIDESIASSFLAQAY